MVFDIFDVLTDKGQENNQQQENERELMWGRDINGNEVLFAVNYRSSESKADLYRFQGEALEDQGFINDLKTVWKRQGDKIDMPNHGHLVFNTEASNKLPIVDRKYNDNSTNQIELSNVLKTELEFFHQKVHNADLYKKKFLKKLNSYNYQIDKHKGQSKDKLSNRQAGKLRKKLNRITSDLKEKKSKTRNILNQKLNQEKNRYNKLVKQKSKKPSPEKRKEIQQSKRRLKKLKKRLDGLEKTSTKQTNSNQSKDQNKSRFKSNQKKNDKNKGRNR